MTLDQSKSLARRFLEEAYNGARFDLLDELLTPDYADRDAPPGFPANREGVRQLMGAFRAAFPDMHFEIHDLMAEGDRVAVRYTVTGTHRGPLMGIEPTGKSINIRGMSLYRVEGDRLSEAWVQYDQLGMMQQLGVVPTPGSN